MKTKSGTFKEGIERARIARQKRKSGTTPNIENSLEIIRALKYLMHASAALNKVDYHNHSKNPDNSPPSVIDEAKAYIRFALKELGVEDNQ